MKTLIKIFFCTISIVLSCILIFKYSNSTLQNINPIKSSSENKSYLSEESILENIITFTLVIFLFTRKIFKMARQIE